MISGKKIMHGIVSLFVLVVLFVVLMPVLRNFFAPSFPEGFRDDTSCRKNGITCPEGKFCMNSQCYDNYVPKPMH